MKRSFLSMKRPLLSMRRSLAFFTVCLKPLPRPFVGADRRMRLHLPRLCGAADHRGRKWVDTAHSLTYWEYSVLKDERSVLYTHFQSRGRCTRKFIRTCDIARS